MSVQDRLCQHLSQSGIHSSEAARFAALVNKWCQDSGVDWTIDRMKQLSMAFKQHLENPEQHYQVPLGWATRVSRKGHTIFKDGLVHRMFQLTEGKGLKLAQSFLRSYQVLKHDKVTRRQFDKWYTGVTGPLVHPTEPDLVDLVNNKIKFGPVLVSYPVDRNGERIEKSIRPMLYDSIAPEKTAPILLLDNKGGFVDMPTRRRTNFNTKLFVNFMSCDPDWWSLWNKYPRHVSYCFTGNGDLIYPIQKSEYKRDLPVGKIGFAQEPGGKLRVFASPMLFVQYLGEPLKARIQVINSTLSNVFVHDHDAGRARVMEILAEGRKCWSFDASAFTDRLPLSLQLSILERLEEQGMISQFDIDVFKTASQKSWYLNAGIAKRFSVSPFVRWEVGQPMGLGPSFPVATLTHAYVCEALCLLLQIPSDRAYTVVGDDVVLSDEKLAILYKRYMDNIGVSINLQKSMVSDQYAEFCGKIIHRKSIPDTMKVRKITNIDQLLTALDFYGKKGYNYLTEREQIWCLKAVLPRYLGGLGYKPDGFSYSEYLRTLKLDKIQQKSLLDELSELVVTTPQLHIKLTLDILTEYYETVLVEYVDEDMVREFHMSFLSDEDDDETDYFADSNDVYLSRYTGLRHNSSNVEEVVDLPPIYHPDGEVAGLASSYDQVNTYRNRFDTALRQWLAGDDVDEPTSPSLTEIQNLWENLLQQTGYINRTEKRSLPPISPIIGDRHHVEPTERAEPERDRNNGTEPPSGSNSRGHDRVLHESRRTGDENTRGQRPTGGTSEPKSSRAPRERGNSEAGRSGSYRISGETSNHRKYLNVKEAISFLTGKGQPSWQELAKEQPAEKREREDPFQENRASPKAKGPSQ